MWLFTSIVKNTEDFRFRSIIKAKPLFVQSVLLRSERQLKQKMAITATVSGKNTLNELTDLKRHTDHKITGIFYIMTFFTSLYLIVTDVAFYETRYLIHVLTALAGCGVSITALRNFKFLSKKAENPGMFAKNRTFSYAFLKENLWFQCILAITFLGAHPKSSEFIPPWLHVLIIFLTFYYREFVPKTSYGSWEVGNKKVNAKSNGWVTFINLQVKIVRWNYVAKKVLLFYMFLLPMFEQIFDLPKNTYITANDRVIFYLLTLDAMHNITTTFFLQTLKFKGFISAELFSFLFNVSPLLGIYLTLKLLFQHHFNAPFALAVGIELWINLEFIYPSKLPFEWKNRLQVTNKAVLVSAAVAYLYYNLPVTV
jgi:hypothetical protein